MMREEERKRETEAFLSQYHRRARKAAVYGGIVLAIGIVLCLIGWERTLIPVLAAVIIFSGALVFVTGMQSLRPDVMLKSFVDMSTAQPDIMLEGIAVLLERKQIIAVPPVTRRKLEQRIDWYRAQEEHDESLLQRLDKGMKNVRKKRIV